MERYPDQTATLWPGVSGDRLFRTGRIVEYSEGKGAHTYHIQTSSGCKGCSGSCSWRKRVIWHTRASGAQGQGGVVRNPDRRNVAHGVLLEISRRGLSLASGLLFGVPLFAFIVAAVLLDGRLGGSFASLASFAVFVFSIGCVGMLARSRWVSFDNWLGFEMTELRHDLDASGLRIGNE
jgi:positive regulator of sigma E activity